MIKEIKLFREEIAALADKHLNTYVAEVAQLPGAERWTRYVSGLQLQVDDMIRDHKGPLFVQSEYGPVLTIKRCTIFVDVKKSAAGGDIPVIRTELICAGGNEEVLEGMEAIFLYTEDGVDYCAIKCINNTFMIATLHKPGVEVYDTRYATQVALCQSLPFEVVKAYNICRELHDMPQV